MPINFDNWKTEWENTFDAACKKMVACAGNEQRRVAELMATVRTQIALFTEKSRDSKQSPAEQIDARNKVINIVNTLETYAAKIASSVTKDKSFSVFTYLTSIFLGSSMPLYELFGGSLIRSQPAIDAINKKIAELNKAPFAAAISAATYDQKGPAANASAAATTHVVSTTASNQHPPTKPKFCIGIQTNKNETIRSIRVFAGNASTTFFSACVEVDRGLLWSNTRHERLWKTDDKLTEQKNTGEFSHLFVDYNGNIIKIFPNGSYTRGDKLESYHYNKFCSNFNISPNGRVLIFKESTKIQFYSLNYYQNSGLEDSFTTTEIEDLFFINDRQIGVLTHTLLAQELSHDSSYARLLIYNCTGNLRTKPPYWYITAEIKLTAINALLPSKIISVSPNGRFIVVNNAGQLNFYDLHYSGLFPHRTDEKIVDVRQNNLFPCHTVINAITEGCDQRRWLSDGSFVVMSYEKVETSKNSFIYTIHALTPVLQENNTVNMQVRVLHSFTAPRLPVPVFCVRHDNNVEVWKEEAADAKNASAEKQWRGTVIMSSQGLTPKFINTFNSVLNDPELITTLLPLLNAIITEYACDPRFAAIEQRILDRQDILRRRLAFPLPENLKKNYNLELEVLAFLKNELCISIDTEQLMKNILAKFPAIFSNNDTKSEKHLRICLVCFECSAIIGILDMIKKVITENKALAAPAAAPTSPRL